ncbi:MAG: HEPN domain-containing protein [Alphaproteobacteria bacterium]|nr:HEPN domain-containing protein [Alphaproteobacteria bacterium]
MTKQNLPKHAELHAQFDAIGLPPYHVGGGHLSQKEENRTRMERALSWLERCEKCSANEIDEQFLFLWISFNAAYGADEHLKKSAGDKKYRDRDKFITFLRLIGLRSQLIAKNAKDNTLVDLIHAHKDDLQKITQSRFLFHDFWRAEYHRKLEEKWEEKLGKEVKRMNKALQDVRSHADKGRAVGTVLEIAFSRLYTLRNQIVHGGASWHDKYNRSSLRICNAVLDPFLRAILKTMLDVLETKPDIDWGGKVAYPPFLRIPDSKTNRKPPNRPRPV